MKVTNFTRSALEFRRQERHLTSLGYKRYETDWKILRGGRQNDIIQDVIISTDGKYVYAMIGPPDDVVVTQTILKAREKTDG